jgi:hypothetical protein
LEGKSIIIPERRRAVGMILSKFGNKEQMPHLSKGGELEKVGESPEPDMSAMHAHMQRMIESIHNNKHEEATTHMMNFLNEHQLHAEKEKDETSEDMGPTDKS